MSFPGHSNAYPLILRSEGHLHVVGDNPIAASCAQPANILDFASESDARERIQLNRGVRAFMQLRNFQFIDGDSNAELTEIRDFNGGCGLSNRVSGTDVDGGNRSAVRRNQLGVAQRRLDVLHFGLSGLKRNLSVVDLGLGRPRLEFVQVKLRLLYFG